MEDDNDVIIPDLSDDTAGTPQGDGNQTPPASTGEVEGVLLDNDEQPTETGEGSGQTSESGDSTTGADGGSGSNTANATTTGQGSGATATGEGAKDGQVAQSQQNQSSQTPQLIDPGEFQPKDYSFDVELADGTKIHVAKPEDIDQIPTDADFGSPQNLMKAQANFNKMVVGIDADKREYDAKKEEFDKQQTESADLEQRITTMINEMNYLETKGRLPKVDPKYENADWSDPEVAKQPGIAERLALLTYRAKENEERSKLGLSPMSVLEAQMQMQQEAVEQRAADTKQRQGDIRKQRGAMVTGPSVSPSTNTPDDMIIGEGGSTRDIGY